MKFHLALPFRIGARLNDLDLHPVVRLLRQRNRAEKIAIVVQAFVGVVQEIQNLAYGTGP